MKGFTLIEILIVVGLIAIIATSGFLSLINFRSHQDLKTASRLLVSVIRDAQIRSISQEDDKFWGVRFSHDDNRVSLWSSDSCSYGAQASFIEIKDTLDFRDPLSGNKDICFDKISGYSISPSDVTIILGIIGDESNTKTIIIRKNGLIE